MLPSEVGCPGHERSCPDFAVVARGFLPCGSPRLNSTTRQYLLLRHVTFFWLLMESTFTLEFQIIHTNSVKKRWRLQFHLCQRSTNSRAVNSVGDVFPVKRSKNGEFYIFLREVLITPTIGTNWSSL